VPPKERRGAWRRAALLAAGAAYALGAASTTPFTRPADVLTALPIIVLAVLVVVRWPLRPRPLETATDAHPFRAPVAIVVAIVAWEAAEYLARGSRGAHPTLSSMADAVDRYFLLKAVLFFVWLCLGAWIIEAGTQSPAAPGAAAETP
jgi:hypothetical protein